MPWLSTTAASPGIVTIKCDNSDHYHKEDECSYQVLSKGTHNADATVSVHYIPTVATLLLMLRSVPRALFASLVAVCAAEPAPQPAEDLFQLKPDSPVRQPELQDTNSRRSGYNCLVDADCDCDTCEDPYSCNCDGTSRCRCGRRYYVDCCDKKGGLGAGWAVLIVLGCVVGLAVLLCLGFLYTQCSPGEQKACSTQYHCLPFRQPQRAWQHIPSSGSTAYQGSCSQTALSVAAHMRSLCCSLAKTSLHVSWAREMTFQNGSLRMNTKRKCRFLPIGGSGCGPFHSAMWHCA